MRRESFTLKVFTSVIPFILAYYIIFALACASLLVGNWPDVARIFFGVISIITIFVGSIVTFLNDHEI